MIEERNYQEFYSIRLVTSTIEKQTTTNEKLSRVPRNYSSQERERL